MNNLFVFAGALDVQNVSNHAKLMEFFRLDKEIDEMQDKHSYKELFHSLAYAVLRARAKIILEQLNIL